jgi:hypothetical protein
LCRKTIRVQPEKMMNYLSNPQLELAFDYVSSTNKNIFLTGRAGTGKTTFLNQLKEHPAKRMVVVAPTGVAAINAGGMTIHSFFQLPFGPFLPGSTREINNKRKFNRDKIRLIQSLDLLVIDEISMVRADLLDGIDDVLRRYKNRFRPFGGVQLLMIGDLHQLPPVVKEDEWEMLRPHYPTPYFFSSQALRQAQPVTIELKHIFRQSDSAFIDLLNRVRDNELDADVMKTLNSRYIANFQPSEDDAYITLTSHNASAQEINAEKLEAIPGAPVMFKAKIQGDFPEHAYPTDELLYLKVGAQVMFVKNDPSQEKRFYNGKIGKITKIDGDSVYVQCPGDYGEIPVSSVEWANVKYTLNEEKKEVEEKEIGSFSQLPLKLAWAITIHKSQGLTFERAIIDAQAAFAHGQVYVALSRCKSFEGIVLRSQLGYSSIKTDSTVRNFSEEAEKNAPDEAHLLESKKDFQQSLIFEMFSFDALKRTFEQLNRVFLEFENSLHAGGFNQFNNLADKAAKDVFPVADKFKSHLKSYFAQSTLPEANEALQERIKKACAWFAEKLNAELAPAAKNIEIVSDNKTVKKTALEVLESLQKEIFIKNACFEAAKDGFSTHAFLKVKANAELDFKAARTAAPPVSGHSPVPKNVLHPLLYAILHKWREHQADISGVSPYDVLPTKSLLELVQFLPSNTAALKKITGIGKGKARQYGEELLEIIEKYCEATQIETGRLPLRNTKPDMNAAPKPDSKSVSFDLFKAGKTIDEIAEDRGLVRSTIESHLTHFISLGELDIFEVVDRKKVETIEQFFAGHDTRLTSDAKIHLGDDYSYGEIRMALKYMERKSEVG